MYVFYFCYERGDAEVRHWPRPISWSDYTEDYVEALGINDCVWLIPGTYCDS